MNHTIAQLFKRISQFMLNPGQVLKYQINGFSFPIDFFCYENKKIRKYQRFIQTSENSLFKYLYKKGRVKSLSTDGPNTNIKENINKINNQYSLVEGLPGLLQYFTSFIIRVRPKQTLNDLPI